MLLLVILVTIVQKATAQDSYEFNTPTFSGIGYSAHILTQEQMKQRNKETERDREEARLREIERDFENSNSQRFLNNFESRVYAQLSKQLVESLFGEDPQSDGTFNLGDDVVTYTSDGVTITLTITSPDGTTTTISIPVGGI